MTDNKPTIYFHSGEFWQDLGTRAAACSSFRWRPGMLATRWRTTGQFDHMIRVGSSIDGMLEVWELEMGEPGEEYTPDLSDPTTQGAVFAQIMKAFDGREIKIGRYGGEAYPGGRWYLSIDGAFDEEIEELRPSRKYNWESEEYGELLVLALEALDGGELGKYGMEIVP